ncbi:flavin reductase family protein [Niabella terrae]
MTIDIETLSPFDKQYYLQHLIGPRPICFASTVDLQGRVNLSPFSFFNLFSTQPPILVFSPSRRMRDNSIKHTLENLNLVPEVAINVVTYDILHQTSLSSCEYPRDVNEFEKAGLSMRPSRSIRPPLVGESKAKFECSVREIKSLGDSPGAGNLVICEVLVMHIDDDLLDSDRRLDQRRIHHVARLGGNWYCKVDRSNLFEVEKPNVKLGIGFDQLPDAIRYSKVLTGNQLAQLANAETLPDLDPAFAEDAITGFKTDPLAAHQHAAVLIDAGKLEQAWQVLLRTVY